MGRHGACLVFFGLAVWMRWLVIGLLVSVGALLFVAGAVARYVRGQKRTAVEDPANSDAQKARHLEQDEALGQTVDPPKSAESKNP